MKSPKGFFLSVAGGGMEMCWLYSLASFTLSATAGRPFPFLEALAAFIAGAWATRLVMGRGWRVAAVLGLNLIGFACAALLVVHATHFFHYSLVDMGWLKGLTGELHGFAQWAGFVGAVFWAFLFWIGGAAMARRPGTYYRFCARFDIGLAAFFCLFLFNMAIRVKGGVDIPNATSALPVFFFFLFSLLAIGISRPGGDGEKTFLSGHGAVAVVMGFVAVVLLLVGWATFFAISGLSAAARSAQGVIKGVADSSLPFIEKILIMMFSRGNIRSEPAASSPRGGAWQIYDGAGGSWWTEWAGKILSYGLPGILGVLTAAMLVLGVALLAKWLFSKTPGKPALSKGSYGIPSWLAVIWDSLKGLGRAVKRFAKRHLGAREAYVSLLRWARRNGCPLRAAETPGEFGMRLCNRFPTLSFEIDLIVHAYNQEVYGGVALRRDRLRGLSRACHTLGNPLYWPLRLRAWAAGDRAWASDKGARI
jgi:hypothetical protein